MGVAAFLQTDRQALVEAARAHLDAHWQEVRAGHAAGESGQNVLRALTQGADEVVKGIVEFGLAPLANRRQVLARASVCALGGYGRAELSPCSDLDICLLYDGQFDSDLEALNSFLVPFLWDIGFKTGYALHSVAEAHELARTDPEVYTTYAQARLLLGSNAAYSRLKLLLAGLRNGPIADAVLAMARRRERPAELHESYRDLYAPEPNLKESVGGLRDYHAALWMIHLQHGQLSLDDLSRLGYLSAEEHLELADGLDFLWRLRNEIHFHLGKPENALTFAVQKHLCVAMGYGEASQPGVARLMQDYYTAARRVRGSLRLAERVCNHDGAVVIEASEFDSAVGIEVRDGRIYAGANDPNWFAESPPRVMEVFWASVRRNLPISSATERTIREHLYLVNDAFRASDVVLRFFLAICRRPMQAGGTLRQMSATGLLGAYLPEFAAVGGIVRYEDFHSYPVDEHTLRAVEALNRITSLEGTVGNMLQKTLEHLRDPQILVLALLFHDLGKAGGEEHVEEGVRIVRTAGRRMGLPDEDIERVAFLVQYHMLMTHTSMYRDIDDPELVVQFAETMKSTDNLRHLMLLSYADLSAVGPNVWTEWKGALLLKLYLRAERHLQGHVSMSDEAFWQQPKAAAVAALLPEGMRSEVPNHLQSLGERYFYAFPAVAIAAHIESIGPARRDGLSVMSVSHEDTGTSELTIITRDKHGLFAEIAGSFASQLVDVRGAMLFTTPDGLVLDCFSVSDASTQGPLSEEKVEDVKEVLRAVLLGGDHVQRHVDQSRRRLFALLQPRTPVPTRIRFDNTASRRDTLIDVETGDRTGLLYDMVRTLADLGLDIVSARIVTDARRARDSFSIRLHDKKIDDVATQRSIRESLESAITPVVVT
nr:protein-PII uridylyltransferase [uncultured bacterium]